MHLFGKKRLLAALLAILCFVPLSLPCLASDETEEKGYVDAEELDALVAPLLEKFGATENNFGLAFTYTATGETYMIHPDSSFYGASLYKLPLCMLYAEKVGLGEMDYDTIVQYQPLSVLMEQTLVYSKNDTAASLYFNTNAPYDNYLLNSYTDLSPEELPEFFKDFYFSPRFMHQTVTTLFNDPERFPGILDYMKKASPNYFFRKHLEGKYEVAQKYGEFEGVLHTAGIIYTPTPIILVVMCNRMNGQLEAIEEFAQLFADYSLTLDQRREQDAAEKAAAEQAEKEEAERRAAEEKAAQEAAEKAERERQAELRRVAEEKARIAELRKNTAILLGVAVTAALGSLAVLRKLRKKSSDNTAEKQQSE